MKKRIMACFLAALLAVSGSGAFSVRAADSVNSHQPEREGQYALPTANILDVDFASGDGTDKSELHNSFKAVQGSSPKEIAFNVDSELNQNTAYFYDQAYVYPFDAEKYARITNAVTMECMFKYHEFWWGEREVFSNQGGGGIGLGVEDENLIFYAHVNGDYRKPMTKISAGEWIHAVGVADGKEVKLYVNGNLVDVVEQQGTVKYPASTNTQNFVIGADSDSSGGGENFSHVTINFARIYDRALAPEEIKLLEEKAYEKAAIKPKEPTVGCSIVAPDTIPLGGLMHVNLHMNKVNWEKVNKITCTMSYDAAKMTYLDVENKKDGVTITKTADGNLEIVCENFSGEEFRQYASTRLGEVLFEIADENAGGETDLEVKDFHVFLSGKETEEIQLPLTKKTVTVLEKEAMDLNGDGVIGAGDIALAHSVDQKKSIAQKAAIYPYKHAIVLTADGAGNVWNPDEIYYAGSSSGIPQKTRDAEIMGKRANTYAMQLFEKEFATSYTAQSVKPAISAQNYTSILHGVYWEEMEKPYQVTNESAANEYFADFGQDTAKYPSMFRAAQNADPGRYLAAFSEWKPILNGIIEPDVAVAKKKSRSDEGGVKSESFADVAAYIRSEKYKNTSIVYMQNDWMDHTGHRYGYYTDTYWGELADFDAYYKAVIDALKETGTYDETLIVANSDHGGSWTNHGSVYSSDTDVFIGLGGQTIDSGARLQGGSNADIPALVLYGLRMEKPSSMTGKVFDERAFLPQEELKKKERDTDAVDFTCTGKDGVLKLTKEKSEIRAADIVLSVGDVQIAKIEAEGGTVLRQELKDGKLYVTISYESQPSVLAKISFQGNISKNIKTDEIMLGTIEGKEVYPDLTNQYKDDSSDLQEKLDETEKKLGEALAKEEAAKKAEAEAKKAEAEALAKEEAAKKAEAEAKKAEAEALAKEEAAKKAEAEALAKAEDAKREAEAAKKAEAEAKKAEAEALAKEEAAKKAEAEAKKIAEEARAAAEEALKKSEAAKKEVEDAKKEVKKLRQQIQNKASQKTKLKINAKSIKIKVGKKYKLKVSASTSHKITFKSNNKKVAVVSSKGIVKGKRKGKAVVTVKCNNATKKVKVTVVK